MYIVAIAWIFVVVLWAAAEATSPQGTPLGALFTLLLYGALPLGIVLYVMGTPMRRRARWRAEQAPGTEPGGGPPAPAASAAPDPDGRGMAAGDAVAPVGKEP